MIKVWCDCCNIEIDVKKEDCLSFSVEVDYDVHPFVHSIISENDPTIHNKTFCNKCYEAMFKKFTGDWYRKG